MLIFSFFIGILTTNCALAQNAEEYKTELRSFLRYSGSDASFTAILDQFYSMMGSGVNKARLERNKQILSDSCW